MFVDHATVAFGSVFDCRHFHENGRAGIKSTVIGCIAVIASDKDYTGRRSKVSHRSAEHHAAISKRQLSMHEFAVRSHEFAKQLGLKGLLAEADHLFGLLHDEIRDDRWAR